MIGRVLICTLLAYKKVRFIRNNDWTFMSTAAVQYRNISGNNTDWLLSTNKASSHIFTNDSEYLTQEE